MSGFATNANARTIDTPRTRPRGRSRPRVLIGGPATLSHQEALCLSDMIKGRGADVDIFRVDENFRIAEFIEALGGCSWLLLAIDESPGRELEMLRETQRLSNPPKIGIICLKDRVNTSDRDHVGGTVELIVRRHSLDSSLTSFSRSHHMMLVEDLMSESDLRPLARTVVPDHVFNEFR